MGWGFNYKYLPAKNDTQLRNRIFILAAFLMDVIVCVLMTAFLRFHIKLASENKTTIENLDK